MTQSKSSSKAEKDPNSTADLGATLGRAAQDFFTQSQHFWAPMQRMMQEQRAFGERVLDDVVQAQADGARRTQESTDEMLSLMKASFEGGHKMVQQLTSMGVDAARRTFETMSPAN